MKSVIKKLLILFSKVKNILLKPPVMVQDNSSGLDNKDPTVNGLVSTQTSLPLNEPNISIKSTLEPNTTTIPMTSIVPPSVENSSNTTIKTTSSDETITGSSKGNVLISALPLTSLTPLVKSLILPALLFLVPMAYIIITYWK